MPTRHKFNVPLIEQLENLEKEKSRYTGTLNIEVVVDANVDEAAQLFAKIQTLLSTDLAKMAIEAIQAVQKEIFTRATSSHEPGLFATSEEVTAAQPALAQFKDKILPMLTQIYHVVSAGNNEITLGIGKYSELSSVQISDIVDLDVFAGKGAAKDSDTNMVATSRGRAVDVATSGGRLKKRTRSVGKSSYTDTWQIVEFGTGIFAKHPDFGWGPRLEGDYKVPDGKGAWFLSIPQNVEYATHFILGQEGGHFLFGVRNDITFAQEELQAATNAIKFYINKALSDKKGTKRRPGGNK